MQFHVMLAALLLAAFQVHGLAIPKPTSVTVDDKTPTVGVQRYEETFVATPDTKTLCALGGMTSMTGDFAREADCKKLATTVEDGTGYWDTYDWAEDNVAHPIAIGGSCNLRISVPSLPDGDGHIWIGNGDVRTAIGQAVAGYAHSGQVAVAGQLTCSDPNGELLVNWSISA
ncbi:hypothetical protein PG994_009572 [Apiospora phragmitis]|uniref:Ecp2 effector protein-like domain-containing protein n=1 Tax=Apiospora phragmitis TaxID=2905665 RepID=A0ABR1U6K1_9PEZI